MALNTLPTLGASCSMVLRSRSLLFAFAGLVGTGNSIVIRSSVCAILVRLRADRMSEGLLSRWHLVTKLLGLPQKGDSGLLPTVTSITYSNGLLRYKGIKPDHLRHHHRQREHGKLRADPQLSDWWRGSFG